MVNLNLVELSRNSRKEIVIYVMKLILSIDECNTFVGYARLYTIPHACRITCLPSKETCVSHDLSIPKRRRVKTATDPFLGRDWMEYV